jgi:hypothetical protein
MCGATRREAQVRVGFRVEVLSVIWMVIEAAISSGTDEAVLLDDA